MYKMCFEQFERDIMYSDEIVVKFRDEKYNMK